MRYASITTSCVADEKPNNTAPQAIALRPPENCGFMDDINTIATIINPCASNNQLRRLPNTRDSSGTGSASINGDHTNLNE